MDIKVNESEWLSVSDEDKKKIKNIVDSFYKHDHNIVPEQGFTSTSFPPLANPFCKIACDAAQAAAIAACAGLAPVAAAVCVAAAVAAGDECRKRC